MHPERFLNYCRKAGQEATEIPEVVAREFLGSIRGETPAQAFAGEQARQALVVFVQEIEHWHWEAAGSGVPGRGFRLKSSAALASTAAESDEASPEAPAAAAGAREAPGAERREERDEFHIGQSTRTAPMRVRLVALWQGRWRVIVNVAGSRHSPSGLNRTRPTAFRPN